jgi:hypothetical protein
MLNIPQATISVYSGSSILNTQTWTNPLPATQTVIMFNYTTKAVGTILFNISNTNLVLLSTSFNVLAMPSITIPING